MNWVERCSLTSCFSISFWNFFTQLEFPGLSSHRYSVIFRADSEIFAFSAMFRAEPVDFSFDISGHNWFSDEHFWTTLWFNAKRYWQAANRQMTWKKAIQAVFSILVLKRGEIKNFRITFNELFWKFLKTWSFEICIFFWFHVSRLLTWKKSEKYQNTACNREKNRTWVNFDVLTVFLGEHVKCLRQQCSWLDQKKAVFFRAASALFRIHPSLFDGAE